MWWLILCVRLATVPRYLIEHFFRSFFEGFVGFVSFFFFWMGLTFFFNFIFKLYIIVLVLPNIKMNPPQVYMCSPSRTLLPPPSPFHPSGSSQWFFNPIYFGWSVCSNTHSLSLSFPFPISKVITLISKNVLRTKWDHACKHIAWYLTHRRHSNY